MKNLKIVIATVITVLLTTVKTFAAPAMPAPAPAMVNPICSVYTADNKLVINNAASQQLDVVITGKDGRQVHRSTVKGTESNISLQKLEQGKYNVTIKNGEKEQRVKLTIL